MEDSEPLGHVAACSLPTPSTPTALSPVELALAFLPFFPGALPSTAQPLIEETGEGFWERKVPTLSSECLEQSRTHVSEAATKAAQGAGTGSETTRTHAELLGRDGFTHVIPHL
jgi:hypothetical protein